MIIYLEETYLFSIFHFFFEKLIFPGGKVKDYIWENCIVIVRKHI